MPVVPYMGGSERYTQIWWANNNLYHSCTLPYKINLFELNGSKTSDNNILKVFNAFK